jgi:hypothetical protein
VALIGLVNYRDEEVDGTREVRQVTAKWPAMVDVDLFHEIAKRIGGHSRASIARRRRQRELFPLASTCAHCGGEYIGGRLAEKQESKRQYAHAKPKARADEDGRRKFDEAGCKRWYVDAEELETKIKDLIVQQRSSKAFEEEVRELILQRDNHRKAADEVVAHAKLEVAQREKEYKRSVKIAMELSGSEDDDDVLIANSKAARAAM